MTRTMLFHQRNTFSGKSACAVMFGVFVVVQFLVFPPNDADGHMLSSSSNNEAAPHTTRVKVATTSGEATLSTQPSLRKATLADSQNRANFEYVFTSTIRSERFPTIQERVRLYTGDWYRPSCSEDTENSLISYQYQPDNSSQSPSLILQQGNQTWAIPSNFQLDHLVYVTRNEMNACIDNDFNGRPYCTDVRDSLLAAFFKDQIVNGATDATPILLQAGDSDASVNHSHVRVPHFRKFRQRIDLDLLRLITNDSTCSRTGFTTTSTPDHPQGILWMLSADRHFGSIWEVDEKDRSWDKKMDKAIFWGAPTGQIPKAMRNATDLERCNVLPRCRLAWLYSNSSLVTAKLTCTRGRFSEVVQGVRVVGDGRKSMNELLEYKGVIMLEGNDVASGLKWALYSKSVVLMPPPTRTSFAMEELLKPFVHYIPLLPDLSDVEEKVRWMIENNEASQEIAAIGRQWIHDLFFDTDSLPDTIAVFDNVVQRYKQHFRQSTNEVVGA